MSDMGENKPHLRSLFDGVVYELDGEMIIGRHAECNIVLDQESGASRKHARFRVDEQNVFLSDLGSLNGTLVNGQEIEGEAQLANGDLLIFDVNEYEVVIPATNAEPEFDPNMTVFINREEMQKPQTIEQPDNSVEEPPIQPEVIKAPEPAEAVHRPGSWVSSANVKSPDLTVLASGVVPMTAQAAQVDLASIFEPTIVVQTGENSDHLLPLTGERTEWSIGSNADRNLRITQAGVSGNHAAIIREGSRWKVVDQMSINGTFVNGNRVNVRFIDNDDLLRFGPVECRFVVPTGYTGSEKSGKKSAKGLSLWKIAIPASLLLILGVGYYAYSTGMLSSTPVTTEAGIQ